MDCGQGSRRQLGGDGVRARSAGGMGSVRVFELIESEVVQTTTLQANGFDELVLTDESFEGLGPSIQDLVMHLEVTNASASFACRVVLQYRYDNGPWKTDNSTLVLGLQTTSDYFIGTAYNDRTKLGRRIRLLLQTCVATGGTVTQRGAVTASVAARFFT